MAELDFDDHADESRIYSTWERAPAFLELLKKVVESDLCSDVPISSEEREAHRLLTIYLDEYQEQSYLLDPWLEQIIVPPVQALRTHAQAIVQDLGIPITSPRLISLSLIIYHIIKTRGYKTIVPFFPHQVEDLAICLEYIQRLQHDPSQTSPAQLWSTRYVLLLWLWLICRIPFDLSNFDRDPTKPGQTASAIETVGRNAMHTSGIERDGAALLLARLYTRHVADCHIDLSLIRPRQDSCSHFPGFLSWSSEYIKGSPSIFSALCIMQTAAEILKSGGIGQLRPFLPTILELSRGIGDTTLLNSNMVVRKYIVKIAGRVGLRLSPPPRPRSRPGKYFRENTAATQDEALGSSEDEEVEVPAEVEEIVGGLLESLQDKDTAIRWSTSKALARIAERLPMDFVNQLLDAVIGLFSIHYAEPGSGIEMPPVAEATWHGACLGCAEFARRGLIRGEYPGQLIKWMLKALFFDVRKGAHSVGSSVRDAACYVLWSLARAQDMDDLRPFALDLAQALVTTSVFDREIHIRRAASAAFQENVGRTGLFPHGIDVLRKTDFYGVSIRRSAFTVAAPQVAENEEYRPYLIDHLLSVTLKHWDASMRAIGAQSLCLICKFDLATLGPEASRRAILMLKSIDPNDVHGALLALAELAMAFQEVESTSPDLSKERIKIFQSLATIPEKTFKVHRNDLLLQASCFVIASSASSNALMLQPDYDGRGLKRPPTWRTIFDAALEHRNQVVQEAAAKAVTALSMHRDCSSDASTWTKEIQTNNYVLQQSLSRLLGSVVYHLHPASSHQAITCLLALVDQSDSAYSKVIESRRNAYDALSTILRDLTPLLEQTLDPLLVERIIRALLKGLEDYTIDERGDVGSWARLACIKGLGQVVLLFLTESSVEINKWLPSHTYHEVVAGILKQGVERLNSHRAEAGKQLVALLEVPHKPGREAWAPDAEGLFRELFVNIQSQGDELEGWQEPAWLYPKAVQLLSIERYRISVLRGLVLSIGSRNESTQKPASDALAAYLHASVETGEIILATSIFQSLLQLSKEYSTLNSMMLPLLTTFEVLLEAGVAKALSESAEGINILVSLCDNTGKRASRLKNLQRILGAMKVVCWLCTVSSVSRKSVGYLHQFLVHQFPKVREETAEYLYLILQTNDVPGTVEAEPFLLETDWTSDGFTSSAESVVQALGALAT